MAIQDRFKHLAISAITEEVANSLDEHPRLIVTASPGAGKSTLLPLSLLEHTHDGKILMLEPRRLAARQVAERMATMLGESVGQTVGYRVRFDTKVSASTRIEVITEGIMERMLIADPTLEGVSVVIFDEFHERSISSDLSLALTREIQNIVRPDLRILIMSATIEASSLSHKIDARHIHCEGKNFEVNIVNSDDFEIKDCAQVVATAVRKAIRMHEGNILAFLPGQAEIMKCLELLTETTQNVEILTLYGMMSPEKQRYVMAPNGGTTRRVVLASPIAETSLTIDGISVVVDSGLYRTPKFNPTTGLSTLTTSIISMDMAIQRSGRAGRLMAGTCYRLWSKATELRMKVSRQPEIETSDLTPMMLTTAAWGEPEPQRLPWVTPPPSRNIANAERLLRLLKAIDHAGHLTEIGRQIAKLPCHPRIASMLNATDDFKALACDIAALLEEKDPLQDNADADISTRLYQLNQYRRSKIPMAWRRIDNIAAQYRRLLKISPYNDDPSPTEIGRLLAIAYPERIAMRDERDRYRLAVGGNIVALHPDDDLARNDFLVIASMGNRIFLAAPVDKDFIKSRGTWVENIAWNSKEGKAVAREELRLGLLTLETRPMRGESRQKIVDAIAAAAPKDGLSMFDFNNDVQGLQLRIAVAASWHPELKFPDVTTDTLLSTVGEWLPLYIGQATTTQELRKIDICSVIIGLLTYDQQLTLDKIAPTHIKLPSGRNAKIQYRRGAEAPVVSARLQDCFGMKATPRVDEGKREVLMELLSPGFKPVQLTQDMEGFWRETYFEVRKELRRRYPKHRWPENPNDISY